MNGWRAFSSAPIFLATEKTTLDAVEDKAIELGKKTSEKAGQIKDQALKKIEEMQQAGDRSLAEAKSVVIGRLQAPVQTFSTLTTEAFEGEPLEAMVERELW